MKRYRAKIDLKRKPDGKFFRAGSFVELELTPESESKLIQQGYIEPVELDAPTQSGSQNNADEQQPRGSPASWPTETEQPRIQSLICPKCGNTNPYSANNCLKCGLALATIRGILSESANQAGTTPLTNNIAPKEPIPPLPDLPSKPQTEELGSYVDSNQFLIRGMGDRSKEIAARFFKQLAKSNIHALHLSVGRLIIKLENERIDSREYYFAEQALGRSAITTMAVRIAPVGTNLYVEWRHYNLPPMNPDMSMVDWGVAVFLLCIYVVPGLSYIWWVKNKRKAYSLQGFQSQDSTAFQLAVRAALEDAIDRAGISKALIQELPTEKKQDRRVI